MSRPVYILAGGGTGGHLCPGIAVADALVRLQADAQVVFACSSRSIDARFLDPLPHGKVVQPVRPVPRSLAQLPGFLRAWRASQRIARDMIVDLQPVAVLGLGGFAAGPVVRQAARRSVPAALLNPDAVPGRANRYLARYADAIFSQFPESREAFRPRLRHKVQCVGCPVRQFGDTPRGEALASFGLRDDRRTLLVLGGSLGAATINEAVGALERDLAALADSWQLLHITGKGDAGAVEAAQGPLHARRVGFCDRMDLAYAAADLVLSRGGASTLAELAQFGLAAVIMPYPYHRDLHQRHNAAALAAAGAAVVCDDRIDASANAQALREGLVAIMADPPRLEAMQAAARTFGARRADEAVARWLIDQGR